MEAIIKPKEYLRVILLSFVGSFCLTYFTCVNCRVNPTNYAIVTLFSFGLWVSLWIGNDALTHFLNRKISWVDFPVKRLVIGLITTVAYTVLTVLAIMLMWEKVMNFNIGDYFMPVAFSLVITFLISLFMHGREFLLQWRKSVVHAAGLEKESALSQYESLKNQVNPHFLFNSLNALTHLVYEDQDKAAKFIKQLSEVYRYVLDSRNKEVVTLEEELKFLDAYLFLQRIRFGDKLNVNVNFNGSTSFVAPLALQMLIENAIKHNVISEEEPLNIRLYIEKSFLVVENDLHKKNILPDSSAGLGLQNIRRRYEFLSKEKVVVAEGEGKFVVKLPMLEMLP